MQADAGNIVVLEIFTSAEGKVKPTIELISKMKLEGNILMAVSKKDSLVERATRNISGLKVVSATYLNVYDILNADKLVITEQALDIVKTWLGEEK